MLSMQHWLILILWAFPVIFIVLSDRSAGGRKILWIVFTMFFNYFALLAFLLVQKAKRPR